MLLNWFAAGWCLAFAFDSLIMGRWEIAAVEIVCAAVNVPGMMRAADVMADGRAVLIAARRNGAAP